MSLSAFLTASALGLVSLTAQDTPAPKQLLMAQAAPFVSSQGIAAPQGDYRTMSNGCTYRRTQAPGYPARWILVVNPTSIGMPKPPRGCRGMM